MAEPSHCPSPQAIPETTEEGHLFKLYGSGRDENIRFNGLKYSEKEGNLRRIMLTVGIESDGHLVVLLKDMLESCPEGSALSKVGRVF